MDTIRERGTVVEIEGDSCRVRLEPEDVERCRQCGLCAQAAEKAAERRVVRVERAGSRTVGESVRVELLQPNPAVAALVVFGLPSLGAGTFAGLAYWAFGRVGLEGTIPAVAAGALGAAAGLGCVKLLDRAWRRRGAYRARIVDEAEPEDGGTRPAA